MTQSQDRIGQLIDRLLEHRDPGFVPPPLSVAVAEAVLGPSGRLLTPHRRLLERDNGAFLFDHALHIFGACESPVWHSLRAWNAPETWRSLYGSADPGPSSARGPEDPGAASVTVLDGPGGLVFFAEDSFGDQFAYRSELAGPAETESAPAQAGEVLCFEAELGRVVPVAASFADWIEDLLDNPKRLLPIDLMAEQRARGEHHRPGYHFFAWPPLCTVESRESVTLGHVDAVEAMQFRAQLARGLAPVGRPGAPLRRVRVEIEGIEFPGDREA